MNRKRIAYYETFFYIIIIFVAVCMPSFFTQIIVEGESDIGPHTDFALMMFDKEPEFTFGVPVQAYTYPVYHLILKIFLTALMGNKVIAAATLLSLLVVFSMMITRWCLKKIAGEEMTGAAQRYLIDLLSIASVFFIGIAGFLTEGRYYLGQGAPNVWHNPTYIMMRPFSWLSFLYVGVLLKEIGEDKLKRKDFVICALLLMVTCLIKPSFSIVLLPAAAVFTIYLMVQKKALKPGFLMLAEVSGTLLVLLVQYIFTQTNEMVRTTSGKFAFTAGSYYGFDFRQSMGALLAMNGIIILYLLAEGCKHLFKDVYDTLTLFMVLFGALEFFFMTDGSAGNFSWGYYMAVNIGTIMALFQSVRYKRKVLAGVTGVIFCYQLLMGLVYLLLYYRGGDYLI